MKSVFSDPDHKFRCYSRSIDKRMQLILQLRDVDKLTWRKIAQKLNMATSRPPQLYNRAKTILHYHENSTSYVYYGLSLRIANICFNAGLKTKEEIREAVITRKLKPCSGGMSKNYGMHSHKELCKWLGVPVVVYNPDTCPHCGGKLT